MFDSFFQSLCMNEDLDFESIEQKSYSDYPEAVRNNAKRVLKYVEENGWGPCGTDVGKQRANQLAKKEALSADVVSRMAQFNRHRKNGKLDADKKDTPWKDNGHVAWLLWGGDEGVDWAMKKADELRSKE